MGSVEERRCEAENGKVGWRKILDDRAIRRLRLESIVAGSRFGGVGGIGNGLSGGAYCGGKMVDAERAYVLFPKEIGLDEDGDNGGSSDWGDAGVASGVESNELSPDEGENGIDVQYGTEEGCRTSGLGTLFFLLTTNGGGVGKRASGKESKSAWDLAQSPKCSSGSEEHSSTKGR
jgi:hypothetical protein